MTEVEYNLLKDKIIRFGYIKEIDWAENVKSCKDSWDFFVEYVWVVLNSGMKNQIAEIIAKRVWKALADGVPIGSVFGHKGKVAAIELVLENRSKYFQEYQASGNKIEYLKTLPWIGDITKYHLAKNLGHDCCKPDRHLVRIATSYNITPVELCESLSKITGDRIATVDLVIWRAANLGFV